LQLISSFNTSQIISSFKNPHIKIDLLLLLPRGFNLLYSKTQYPGFARQGQQTNKRLPRGKHNDYMNDMKEGEGGGKGKRLCRYNLQSLGHKVRSTPFNHCMCA
jgi:hypothetical protein